MKIMTFPQTNQAELIALADLVGIPTVPGVYGIILELLTLQVSPEDIHILLKDICLKLPEMQQTTNDSDDLPDAK